MLITIHVHSEDLPLFLEVINCGIDSHLEAFTKSRFDWENPRLVLDFHPDEIQILLRRLTEIDSQNSWIDDIVMEAYGEICYE